MFPSSLKSPRRWPAGLVGATSPAVCDRIRQTRHPMPPSSAAASSSMPLPPTPPPHPHRFRTPRSSDHRRRRRRNPRRFRTPRSSDHRRGENPRRWSSFSLASTMMMVPSPSSPPSIRRRRSPPPPVPSAIPEDRLDDGPRRHLIVVVDVHAFCALHLPDGMSFFALEPRAVLADGSPSRRRGGADDDNDGVGGCERSPPAPIPPSAPTPPTRIMPP